MNARLTVRPLAVAAAAVTAATALAGCGSATQKPAGKSSGVTVDVRSGTPVTMQRKGLRIAFFSAGSSNSFLQAGIDAAKKTAAKRGVPIDVFDGAFDPATQFNQMQNALSSGKYGAWIVEANNGEQACDMVSRKAPKAGIVVSVVLLPVCGRASNEGSALYQPGTLNFIGGNETPATFKAVLDYAVRDSPGRQKVGVLTGPDLNTNTLSINRVLDGLKKTHPEFKVVATARTDYSVPVSQQKAEAMIQAHPDLSVIFGAYSNITKGAVNALKAADRLGKVRVYDTGGTTWSKNALQKGWIRVTTAHYARSLLVAGVNSLVDAAEGKRGERVVYNNGHPMEPGHTDTGTAMLVTRKNVDALVPESD